MYRYTPYSLWPDPDQTDVPLPDLWATLRLGRFARVEIFVFPILILTVQKTRKFRIIRKNLVISLL
jgi:hypothetical protein